MGANIYWEPVSKRPKDLSTLAPSSFMATLRALVKKEVRDQLSGIPVSQLMQKKET